MVLSTSDMLCMNCSSLRESANPNCYFVHVDVLTETLKSEVFCITAILPRPTGSSLKMNSDRILFEESPSKFMCLPSYDVGS